MFEIFNMSDHRMCTMAFTAVCKQINHTSSTKVKQEYRKEMYSIVLLLIEN